MKYILCFFASALFLVACSNSSTTTEETKDTGIPVTTDTTINSGSDVVTPPASNGQF
ncbi:hypothetical protein HRG84_23360 [Flavisolibacter sp. BT320]|nr:hypothetical protein [Flavisolibacter longurius]